MRKNYHFKTPVTKEILGNGTEIWRNNLTKKFCFITPDYTIFFDGKDSFWIYGEVSIKAKWSDKIHKNAFMEFYKGRATKSRKTKARTRT